MKNVEMATRFPLDFCQENFCRGKIEILRWERFDEGINVAGKQCHNKIRIKGQSRTPISDGGESADEAVDDARLLEPAGDQINFLHEWSQKCAAWPLEFPFRSKPDVECVASLL